MNIFNLFIGLFGGNFKTYLFYGLAISTASFIVYFVYDYNRMSSEIDSLKKSIQKEKIESKRIYSEYESMVSKAKFKEAETDSALEEVSVILSNKVDFFEKRLRICNVRLNSKCLLSKKGIRTKKTKESNETQEHNLDPVVYDIIDALRGMQFIIPQTRDKNGN